MADIFGWYDDLLQSRYAPQSQPPDLLANQSFQAQQPPQTYQTAPDTIPFNTDMTRPDTGGGTYWDNARQAAGDIYRAGAGVAERFNKGTMNMLGLRAPGAPMYQGEIDVGPGMARLGDAATFASGGLTSPLSPMAGTFRTGAQFARPAARQNVLAAYDAMLGDAGPASLPETGRWGPEAGAVRIPNPIRAYHGSPHDFDRFDISKIGTGEGNQSFTRGLYFAEAEPVATGYRDNVKNMALIDANNKRMAEIAREMEALRKPGSYRDFKDPRGYDLADEYDRLMAEKMQPGHMYEVDIHATPQSFLDLDKTLGEQSGEVRAALQRGGAQMESMGGVPAFDAVRAAATNPYRAADLFNRGGEPLQLNAADVAYRLNQSGIPGARYLDEYSRIMPTEAKRAEMLDQAAMWRRTYEDHLVKAKALGIQPDHSMLRDIEHLEARANRQPTRNYSVYNDELIDILRKYGIIAPGIGIGASALSGSRPQEAY